MPSDAADAIVQRGIDHHKAGRIDEAAALYREALSVNPQDSRAAQYLGVICLQRRQLGEAIDLLRRAVAAKPDWPEARNNLGVALRERGDMHGAAEAFRAVVAARPELFDPQNSLAKALLHVGDLPAALEAAEKAHRLNPAHAEPLLTIATLNLLRGAPERAFPAVERVLAAEPGNVRAIALHRFAISRVVPPWHFAMMNDTTRNDAYEAAIRRAVGPDTLVLDIGTGSGLLSMMAARAGARQVVACEATPQLAARAKHIVAENGLADRITVHNKRSQQLVVGVELPEKADVLVSEIFDSDLVGEGVLPSLEDAHARLLKPNAKIIPQAASCMLVLAGGDVLRDSVEVGTASGFKVGGFNAFMPERFMFDGAHCRFDWLSEPVAALRFDFRETCYPQSEEIVSAKVTRSGLCVGVVQWLHVDLDDQASYQNRPGISPPVPNGWLHSLYTFAPPVEVKEGQTVRFVAGHVRHFPYFQFVDVK